MSDQAKRIATRNGNRFDRADYLSDFPKHQIFRWYDRRYDFEVDPRQIIIESNKAKDLHDHFLSKPSPERSRRNDWRT